MVKITPITWNINKHMIIIFNQPLTILNLWCKYSWPSKQFWQFWQSWNFHFIFLMLRLYFIIFLQFPFSPNNLNMKMCVHLWLVRCTFSTHDEYYLARSIIYYGKKWSGQLSNHSLYDLCIRHSSKRLSYF